MPYAEKRRLEKERMLKNDSAKCRKLKEFFAVGKDNSLPQDERPSTSRSTRPTPTTLPAEPPPDNPVVQLQKNYQESEDRPSSQDNANPYPQPEMIPVEKGSLVKTIKEYYRGYPLDIKVIVRKAGGGDNDNVLTIFYEKSGVATKDARKRTFVKCLVCAEFGEEARKFSGNSRVYMAQGVRCDGKKKLQDVIDHLHSTPYAAAMERKRITALWNSKDDRHPWIKLRDHMTPMSYKH